MRPWRRGTLKGGAEDMALDLNLNGIGGKAKVAPPSLPNFTAHKLLSGAALAVSLRAGLSGRDAGRVAEHEADPETSPLARTHMEPLITVPAIAKSDLPLSLNDLMALKGRQGIAHDLR